MGLEALFGGNPQQQGLLAAIAQIAQASGPQRMPQSLYGILGGGMMAGQQATQQAQEQQQVSQLRDFAIRDKRSDVEAQEAQRKRAAELLKLNADYQKMRGGPQLAHGQAQFAHGAAQSAPPADRSASAVFQGLMGGSAPAMSAPGAPMPGGRAAGGQDPRGGIDLAALAQERLAYAQYLQEAGYSAEAYAEQEKALKMMPEFDTTPRTANDANGKPFQYILGKRGETQRLEGMLPREELKLMNLGGKEQAYNPFELRSGQEFKRTMTPGEIAADRRASQANALKAQELLAGGRPQFSAELGGFISRPTSVAPNGTFTPLAGHVKRPPMTEDQAKATGWLVQAENGWKNMKAVAFGKDGSIADAAKPGRLEAMASAVPFGLGAAGANMARSTDRQKFVQAASSTSEALLRAATGAGVNREEAEQKVREITPVWGDDDETIRQKMDAMPLYIDSLKARAGNGAALAADVLKRHAKPEAGGWSIQRVD